ncbi:MAG: HAD family hydrolase [Dehalococcoidia bacterium]
MKALQAVFFDLDQTLLDGSGSREAIRRTCTNIAASRSALSAAQLLEANTEVWQRYWPEVENKWTLGALDGRAMSLEAWRRTLRACGCDDESLALHARDMHWRNGREALRLFDDARELLTLLRDRVVCALITNGASDTQREALRALGIEDYFGAVVISGELGAAKPDASVFRVALDKLGVEPEAVWHVGDSLMTDVAGATAANLTAVWLNRGGVPRRECDPRPDYEIRSLAELAPLLSATGMAET